MATSFPAWAAGSRITAALLTEMEAMMVIKPADQSVTSSATFVNDTDLVSALTANATYLVAAFINYEGGTQGAADIKLQWLTPAGASLKLMPAYVDTGGTSHVGNNILASTVLVAGSNGAGVPRNLTFQGSLVVSSTTGNLQLQWAQNTSNATPTIVHAQSSLSLVRVA